MRNCRIADNNFYTLIVDRVEKQNSIVSSIIHLMQSDIVTLERRDFETQGRKLWKSISNLRRLLNDKAVIFARCRFFNVIGNAIGADVWTALTVVKLMSVRMPEEVTIIFRIVLIFSRVNRLTG